jgi:Fe-S cluster assembly protein SufD
MSLEEVKVEPKQKFLDIYQEHINDIKNGSPDYINEIRDEAIKQFEILGIPDKKDENYKYTDLNAEFDNGYKMYLSPKNIKFEVNDIFTCDVPDLNTKVILLLN